MMKNEMKTALRMKYQSNVSIYSEGRRVVQNQIIVINTDIPLGSGLQNQVDIGTYFWPVSVSSHVTVANQALNLCRMGWEF
jgi:hypothetical protein